MERDIVKTTIGVMAVMLVWMSGTAQAAPVAAAPRQLAVKYSDLNLSDPADAAELYKRMVQAAHLVCELPHPWDVVVMARMRGCVHHALSRGVRQVNAPELTRHFASRQGYVPAGSLPDTRG